MKHEPFRLRSVGHCLDHRVRFNHTKDTWQHMPPNSPEYLDTNRRNAAFVIANGGWIVPFRQTVHVSGRIPKK